MRQAIREIALLLSLPSLMLLVVFAHVLGLIGPITYELSPGAKSQHVMSFLPANRVEVAEGAWHVLAEPTYVSVFPPFGAWQHLRVTITFKPGVQRLVELGLLGSLQFQSFDFKTLWNDLIPTDWVMTPVESGILYTRPGVSTDLAQLDRSRVRTSRATVDLPYDASRSKLQAKASAAPFSLAGAHELLVAVPDGGDLYVYAWAADENRAPGSDETSLKLIAPDGRLVISDDKSDDGNVSDDRRRSEGTDSYFIAKQLSAGVYRIMLSSTSDITWSNISTNAESVVLTGRSHFVDCPPSLVVNGSRVTVEARSVDTFGEVSAGLESGVLQKIGDKVGLPLYGASTELKGCNGDAIVSTDGVIGLSSKSFYPATILPLTLDTNIDDVDAIVAAPASSISSADGVATTTVDFDLANRPLERGAYRLALSAPGVAPNKNLAIKSIKFTFTREPLTWRQAAGTLKRYLYALLP